MLGVTRLLSVALAGVAAAPLGCELAHPEVVVVHELGEAVLVRQLSFSGCLWTETLSHEQASAPGRCLPGSDRVHLQRFDAASYCTRQAEDGNLPELCLCDPAAAPAADPLDLGILDAEPHWFNYQTSAVFELAYGDFARIVLRTEDLEQDFSVPGPYGH